MSHIFLTSSSLTCLISIFFFLARASVIVLNRCLFQPQSSNISSPCAQIGPLRSRKKLPACGLWAVLWPAIRNQTGCGDSRVPGGLCERAVRLDPFVGGGLPQRCWAHQRGHHGYRAFQKISFHVALKACCAVSSWLNTRGILCRSHRIAVFSL